MFTDRARRARPGFAVADDNTGTVTEICRRLDGMPLAIELAAARVRALSLDEIVDGLHDRFRLLTGGARTAVRRQQTLRASVDWSHALLTEPERMLFRRLAVFMGGFDLDAAQAVAGAADVERFQVLDQLSLLVDKSLVIAENTSGRTRYRLLETVRQYALEKLGESGEADKVGGRHRDHYTAMATRLDAPANGDHEQCIAQAEIEMDNLRAAFAWSRENVDIVKAVGAGVVAAAAVARTGPDARRACVARRRPSRHRLLPNGSRTIGSSTRAFRQGRIEFVGGCHRQLGAGRGPGHRPRYRRPGSADTSSQRMRIHHRHDGELARPYFTEAISLARGLGDSWRLSQILERQSYGAFSVGRRRELDRCEGRREFARTR